LLPEAGPGRTRARQRQRQRQRRRHAASLAAGVAVAARRRRDHRHAAPVPGPSAPGHGPAQHVCARAPGASPRACAAALHPPRCAGAGAELMRCGPQDQLQILFASPRMSPVRVSPPPGPAVRAAVAARGWRGEPPAPAAAARACGSDWEAVVGAGALRAARTDAQSTLAVADAASAVSTRACQRVAVASRSRPARDERPHNGAPAPLRQRRRCRIPPALSAPAPPPAARAAHGGQPQRQNATRHGARHINRRSRSCPVPG